MLNRLKTLVLTLSALVYLALASFGCSVEPARTAGAEEFFVVDFSSGVYLIDARTGDRTIFSSSSADVGSGDYMVGSRNIVVDDLGRLIVLAEGSYTGGRGIFIIDPDSGSRDSLPQPPSLPAVSIQNPNGLAVGTDQQIYVTSFESNVRGARIIRVDLDSGARTIVSSDSIGTGPRLFTPSALTIDQSGRLFVYDPEAAAILRVDPVSGDRVYVSSPSVGSGTSIYSFGWHGGLAFGGDGNLYVAPSNFEAVIRVEPRTGNRLEIPLGQLSRLKAISADLNGDLLLYGGSALGRLNPATGELTIVSGYDRGTGPLPRSADGIAAY